ncbi:MAG: glycerate kinase [Thermoguttaceae bacterium]|nr:glycerate kinase [Thermoguttaceae bacterium]MDW8038157.1 glycerate kinase [Thermoguttaceae bacterium]
MICRSLEQLRHDGLAIWQAGVDAVRSDRLMQQAVQVEGGWLRIGPENIPLASIRRIVVVGAGKAGAGMAAALEEILGPPLMEEKELTGWVNVPADCVCQLRRIHLHPARPPGINEPTEEALRGTEEILRLVGSLGPEDLCLCLISGGGSALLPAPIEGISLADKLAVTRFLSAAGANIEQLNTVRKQLSRVKGGRLAHACRAGRLVSLIISDVLGDPLDVIASGPTVPDSSTPEAALEVLRQFHPRSDQVPERIWHVLQALAEERKQKAEAKKQKAGGSGQKAEGRREKAESRKQTFERRPLGSGFEGVGSRGWGVESGECGAEDGLVYVTPNGCRVVNLVIGNNATAVRAAAQEARRRGYLVVEESASRSEGLADELGVQFAQRTLQMRLGPGPDCLISGGEPVVQLVEPARRGRGGRNQQLVLAALNYLLQHDQPLEESAQSESQGRLSGRPSFLSRMSNLSQVQIESMAALGAEGSVVFASNLGPAPTESMEVPSTTWASRPGWGLLILSGGTDGEDGPTDAAGAWVDEEVIQLALRQGLQPADFLARNDAYNFFLQTGSLIRTGPTHTNVCDLRVAVVARKTQTVA